MLHYIKKLIEQGEHQQLDFKFEISDAKKIARSLVAFANTDGGRLLVGVKDNGAITGVRSDEEVYMIGTAAHLYCKPEVQFTAQNHLVDGKVVVECVVEPSKQKPHFAPDKDNQWTAYIRVKDENMAANNVMLQVWEKLNQPEGVYLKYTDAEQMLLAYLEHHGRVSFIKASRIAKTSKNKTETLLVNLIALGLIEPVVEDHKFQYQLKSKGNFTF
jgi:predicted HTH transcriptional regulator